MNLYFIISAILLFIVGAIHSISGEKRFISPLLNYEMPESTFGKTRLDWRTVFRNAWHLTTLAWWTIGIIIIDFAVSGHSSALSIYAIAIPFAICGTASLVLSKGKHPSVILLGVAGFLLAGLYF